MRFTIIKSTFLDIGSQGTFLALQPLISAAPQKSKDAILKTETYVRQSQHLGYTQVTILYHQNISTNKFPNGLMKVCERTGASF